MLLFATFSSSVLLSTGILLIRKFFFGLGENTLSLLNTLLDNHDEDEIKQRKLIKNLGKTLTSLFLFLVFLALVLFITLLPFLVYVNFDLAAFQQLDTESWAFVVVFLVGSVLPFLFISFRKPKSDYSELSVLLHRMVLNNPNIALSLFKMEKTFFKKKTQNPNPVFLVVSGLARAGTTGLTTLLHQSDKFYSLSYANMPFLMNPNSWKLVYKPRDSKLKERSHGDKVMFGLNTVEALEEFFFKAQLRDGFIKEKELIMHEIDADIHREYLVYQQLLKPNGTLSTYLAKNNNLLLRYRSLRTHNPEFIAVFLFRNPVEHAYSLLKQHQGFLKKQTEDAFTLEYMNWLGHHEFGRNHKYFAFTKTAISDKYEPGSINYWLCIWINYYTELLQFVEDKNLYLLNYEDFLHNPAKVIASLEEIMQESLGITQIAPFKNTNQYAGEIDETLQKQALGIFDKLKQHQIRV